MGEKKFNKKTIFWPGKLKSGESYKYFFNTTLLKPNDFECLVNQSIFNYLNNYFDIIQFNFHFIKKVESIEGFFFNNMIVLLMEKYKRIKIIYKGELEGNIDLIQLNLDFLEENNNAYQTDKTNDSNSYFNKFKKISNKIWNFLIEENETAPFNSFINKNIQNNSKYLFELINNSGIGFLQNQKFSLKGKFYFKLTNINLTKKYFVIEQKQKLSQTLINNIDNPRIIGLNNVGATCYMNATLQCLFNIDKLTRYLLVFDNFSTIINNANKCEVISCYCFLLQKIWCDEKVANSYSPKEFKEIISQKNPLFEGIQANDSKDLIYFLIEQMNYELNQISKPIINNNYDGNNILDIEKNQINENLMLTYFIMDFSYKNNNIIPKLFFSIIENEIICNVCNTHKYNFQTIYSLEFNLKSIFKKIYGPKSNSINKKIVNLNDCFNNYNQTHFFKDENSIYCNICKSKRNSTFMSKIYSLSPILIIILDREKGNSFKCDVDFPQNLNVQQYIKYQKSNINYNLIGVVSHLGSSDMFGHFIAYCRHRILKDWFCYNDSHVTLCDNQFNDFKKGDPYILFYESTEQGINNILFNNNILNNIFNNGNNMISMNYMHNININSMNNSINNINNNIVNFNNNKNNNNMNYVNNMNNIKSNMNNN